MWELLDGSSPSVNDIVVTVAADDDDDDDNVDDVSNSKRAVHF